MADDLEAPALTLTVPYDTPAQIATPAGLVTETLAPGCFSEHLASDADVLVLAQHDYDRPLARRNNGSATLQDTPHALTVTVPVLPATTWASDIRAALDAGLLAGASPRLRVPAGGLVLARDGTRRIVRSALPEVSVVTVPAYPHSSARSAAATWRHDTETWPACEGRVSHAGRPPDLTWRLIAAAC